MACDLEESLLEELEAIYLKIENTCDSRRTALFDDFHELFYTAHFALLEANDIDIAFGIFPGLKWGSFIEEIKQFAAINFIE